MHPNFLESEHHHYRLFVACRYVNWHQIAICIAFVVNATSSSFSWRQDFYYSIQHESDDQTFGNIFPYSLKRGLMSYNLFRPLKLYFGSLKTVERTCWITDSWWCCLSLNVWSSIPAFSTTFFRFLCRLYAFPCARASTINTTNMYIVRAKA